jgi:T3SS (YopN, CesT) and YbjN peptide-binding chaperone 3
MDDWQALISQLGEDAESLRVDQFVILDYTSGRRLDPDPYAQAAHAGPDGLICEVVSDVYLPAGRWPLDEVALRRAGWSAPSQGTENWWRLVETSVDVAAVLVEGLRLGRACTDPEAFSWSVGTFPPGPGDGEPVPVPAPLPGEMAQAA